MAAHHTTSLVYLWCTSTGAVTHFFWPRLLWGVLHHLVGGSKFIPWKKYYMIQSNGNYPDHILHPQWWGRGWYRPHVIILENTRRPCNNNTAPLSTPLHLHLVRRHPPGGGGSVLWGALPDNVLKVPPTGSVAIPRSNTSKYYIWRYLLSLNLVEFSITPILVLPSSPQTLTSSNSIPGWFLWGWKCLPMECSAFLPGGWQMGGIIIQTNNWFNLSGS